MSEQLEAIKNYSKAKRKLRELNVIRSERIQGELGEFYFRKLFGGEPAKGSSQKGWDIILDGKRIQVKSHAKAANNNAQWTSLSDYNPSKPAFDQLYVFIFSQDLILTQILWCGGQPFASGKQTVKWKNLKTIALDDIPQKVFLKTLRDHGLIDLESGATRKARS